MTDIEQQQISFVEETNSNTFHPSFVTPNFTQVQPKMITIKEAAMKQLLSLATKQRKELEELRSKNHSKRSTIATLRQINEDCANDNVRLKNEINSLQADQVIVKCLAATEINTLKKQLHEVLLEVQTFRMTHELQHMDKRTVLVSNCNQSTSPQSAEVVGGKSTTNRVGDIINGVRVSKGEVVKGGGESKCQVKTVKKRERKLEVINKFKSGSGSSARTVVSGSMPTDKVFSFPSSDNFITSEYQQQRGNASIRVPSECNRLACESEGLLECHSADSVVLNSPDRYVHDLTGCGESTGEQKDVTIKTGDDQQVLGIEVRDRDATVGTSNLKRPREEDGDTLYDYEYSNVTTHTPEGNKDNTDDVQSGSKKPRLTVDVDAPYTDMHTVIKSHRHRHKELKASGASSPKHLPTDSHLADNSMLLSDLIALTPPCATNSKSEKNRTSSISSRDCDSIDNDAILPKTRKPFAGHCRVILNSKDWRKVVAALDFVIHRYRLNKPDVNGVLISRKIPPMLLEFISCDNVTVQDRALVVLNHMIVSGSSEEFDHIMQLPFIPQLVRLVNASVMSHIQMQVVWTIDNIALDMGKHRQQLLDAGVVDALLKAVSASKVTRPVIVRSAMALRTLITGDTLNYVEHQEQIDKLLTFLSKLLHTTHLQGDRLNCLYAACCTLVNLTENDDEYQGGTNEEVFNHAGIVTKLVMLSRSDNTTTVDIQASALNALSNLVCGTDDVRVNVLLKHDILSVLHSALKSESDVLVHAACRCLANICAQTEDVIQTVIDAKLIPIAVYLMQHASNQIISNGAAYAVMFVAHGASLAQTQYLIDLGVIPLVAALLDEDKQSSDDSREVMSEALRCLTQVLFKQECVSEFDLIVSMIGAAGGWSQLTRLRDSDDGGIKQLAEELNVDVMRRNVVVYEASVELISKQKQECVADMTSEESTRQKGHPMDTMNGECETNYMVFSAVNDSSDSSDESECTEHMTHNK